MKREESREKIANIVVIQRDLASEAGNGLPVLLAGKILRRGFRLTPQVRLVGC